MSVDQPSEALHRQSKAQQIVEEVLLRAVDPLSNEDVDQLVQSHPKLADELRSEIAKLWLIRSALSAASHESDRRSLVRTLPQQRSPKITGYEVVARIGLGGQASVWEAVQKSTMQPVAIKVLHGIIGKNETAAKRFEREIHVLADLRHPNIVPLIDRGVTDDGDLYVVMRLIDGQDLCDWMETLSIHDTGIDRRLEMFMRICSAIEAAHAKGIVHRDLKPSNIRINRRDEPYVLDFGLARRTHVDDPSESFLTRTGQFVGSLNWASPEQVRGDATAAEPTTDVHALGVILYELLSGQLPFHGHQSVLFNCILYEVPISPRRLNPRLDRDLETVCLRCLEKEPSKRFRNAGELLHELQRYRDGDPIESRPISLARRFRRWVVRHPVQTAVIALATFLTVAGPMIAWREHQLRHSATLAHQLAVTSQREAETQASRAQANESRAFRQAYCADMNNVGRALEDGNAIVASELLSQYLPRPDHEDVRGVEWRLLWKLCHQGLVETVVVDKPIRHFDISPDSNHVAVFHSDRSGSDAGFLMVNLKNGDARPVTSDYLSSNKLCFAGPSEVFSAGLSGSLHRWQLGQDKVPVRWMDAWTMALLPNAEGGGRANHNEIDSNEIDIGEIDIGEVGDGQVDDGQVDDGQVGDRQIIGRGPQLVTAGDDGVIRVWSIALDEDGPRAEWKLPQRLRCRNIETSPAGDRIAVFGLSELDHTRSTLYVIDTKTGGVVWNKMFNDYSMCLAYSPDGHTIATRGPSGGGAPRLWNATDGTAAVQLEAYAIDGAWLRFSPDGKYLLSAGELHGNAYVWNTETGERMDWVLPHPRITSAAWIDDNTIVTGGLDGCLRRWQVDQMISKETRSTLPATSVWSVSRVVGNQIALADNLDFVQVWDLSSRKRLRTLTGHFRHDPVILEDGSILALSGTETIYRFAAASSKQEVYFTSPRSKQIHDFSVSPNGRWLGVACGADGEEHGALCVDLTTNRLAELATNNSGYRIAFADNSQLMVILTGSGTVHIWNVSDWQRIHTIPNVCDSLAKSLTIAPNAKSVAVGENTGTVRLFSIQTGEMLQSIANIGQPVRKTTFSDDGRTLIVAYGHYSMDPRVKGEIRFWDVESGKLIIPLSPGIRPCIAAELVNGSKLVSVHYPGELTFWDAASDEDIHQQFSRAQRAP